MISSSAWSGNCSVTGLRSDIVVAPHHGSRSSSAATFIAATQRPLRPVLGPVGPIATVFRHRGRRWFAAGAQAKAITATSGTIGFVFPPTLKVCRPRQHRRGTGDSGGTTAVQPSPLAASSGDWNTRSANRIRATPDMLEP